MVYLAEKEWMNILCQQQRMGRSFWAMWEKSTHINSADVTSAKLIHAGQGMIYAFVNGQFLSYTVLVMAPDDAVPNPPVTENIPKKSLQRRQPAYDP